MPLKNSMPGDDLFVTHWNWLELLLYGRRRVPAVHVRAPPEADTSTAFWEADKIDGSDPLSDAQ